MLTAQHFVLRCSCPSSFYYAGNPYLINFGYGAKIKEARQEGGMASMPPFPKRGIDNMSFPPHPSAPGGSGVPGPSGRHVGKLYLAGVSARAAAARRKQDRTNVLLASTNKI